MPMNESEFNRKVYNAIAMDYKNKREQPANSTWNDYLETPAMTALIQHMVKGKDVLDLGCGTGILTKQIKEWECKYICGIDHQ